MEALNSLTPCPFPSRAVPQLRVKTLKVFDQQEGLDRELLFCSSCSPLYAPRVRGAGGQDRLYNATCFSIQPQVSLTSHLNLAVPKISAVFTSLALLVGGLRHNSSFPNPNFPGDRRNGCNRSTSSVIETKASGGEGAAGICNNQGFIASEVQGRADLEAAVYPSPILAGLLQKLCQQKDAHPEEVNPRDAARFRDLVLSKSLNLAVLRSAPRRRLLIATAHFVRQKVADIDESAAQMQGDDWSQLCNQALDPSTSAVFNTWMALEASEPSACSVENTEQNAAGRAAIRGAQIFGSKAGGGRSQNAANEELAELHSELLFLLRFNRTRPGSHFKAQSVARHAPDILDDLVISLAEAVASTYLDRWLIGGPAGEELPVLMRSNLASTRKLEKFRNEVALRKWLHNRFGSVEAIYEDRIDLWTIKSYNFESQEILSAQKKQKKSNHHRRGRYQSDGMDRTWPGGATAELSSRWESGSFREDAAGGVVAGRLTAEESAGGEMENRIVSSRAFDFGADGSFTRLNRLETQGNSRGLDAPASSNLWRQWGAGLLTWATNLRGNRQSEKPQGRQRVVDSLAIERSFMPARRMKELRALQRGRLAFSLYLEVSDVAGPILRALLEKLGDVISFLLTFLIGRSMGLIYRGIRQSLHLKT